MAHDEIWHPEFDRLADAAFEWSYYDDASGKSPSEWMSIFQQLAYGALKISKGRSLNDLSRAQAMGLAAVYNGMHLVITNSMAKGKACNKIKQDYRKLAYEAGRGYRSLINYTLTGEAS